MYILEAQDFWSYCHLHKVFSKDARRGRSCNIAWEAVGSFRKNISKKYKVYIQHMYLLLFSLNPLKENK